MNKLGFNDQVYAQAQRLRKTSSGLLLSGYVKMTCYDRNGRLKGYDEGPNLLVDQGIEFIMDVALSGGTQDTTFFIGLKDTGTVAPGDTAASHAGWVEITAIIAARLAWIEAGVSSKVITNAASVAAFAITGTDTVFGAFLATDLSGTGGSLIGAKDFAASQAVNNGDTLNVTYQITGSSS